MIGDVRLSSQFAHAHATGLNHAKMTGPILSRRTDWTSTSIEREAGPEEEVRKRITPQDGGRSAFLASSPKSLSKVRMMRPRRRHREDERVTCAAGNLANPNDIACAATPAPGTFSSAQKAHLKPRSGRPFPNSRRRVHRQDRRGCSQWSARVVGENFGFGPPVGEQADNERGRKSCAGDDRFPQTIADRA